MTPDDVYPFWRWHAWEKGRNVSYDAIEELVERGDLLPFTCGDINCDCPWTKLYCEWPQKAAA